MRIIVIISFCLFGTALGQTGPPPDDCLMKCMNNMYQNSKGSSGDAMGMMDVQKVQVGNVTAMCPRMNDTSKLDKVCGPLKDLMKCADPCPDSEIKKLTLSAFKAAKFMCVDRYDDIKKNMPCMSDSCPDVQRACVPKCGSVEATTDRVSGLIRGVQGVPQQDSATNPPGHGHGSTSPPNAGSHQGQAKDVDMSTIRNVIGDTCTTISCFMTCSEAPTTKACGKDAYILSRDMVWTMFSALAQSMSSLGIQQQWPDQCQPILVAGGTPSPAVNATVVVIDTHHGTGTPAGTVPLATGTPAGTGTPLPGTPAGTAPPAGTTVATGNVKVAAVKECKNPPCGSSTTIISSTFLIFASIAVLLLRKI